MPKRYTVEYFKFRCDLEDRLNELEPTHIPFAITETIEGYTAVFYRAA